MTDVTFKTPQAVPHKYRNRFLRDAGGGTTIINSGSSSSSSSSGSGSSSGGGSSTGTSAVLTESGGANFKWSGDLVTGREVGSIAKGETFKVGITLEEIIRKLFYVQKVYKAGTIAISCSTAVEYGSKSLVITITITQNDAGAPSNIKLYIGSDDAVDIEFSEGTYTYTYTYTGAITSNLSITAQCDFAAGSAESGITAKTGVSSNTVTVQPKYRWYAGWVTEDVAVTAIVPTSMQKSGLYTGTYSEKLYPNGAYWFYVAVPSTAGKPSWVDSLESDYFDKSATVQGTTTLYGGITYRYYAYYHEATCGDGKQAFTVTIK